MYHFRILPSKLNNIRKSKTFSLVCIIKSETSFLHSLVHQPSSSFMAPTCSNSTQMGTNCNISKSSCDILQPCQNNGVCNNTNTTLLGYLCLCPPGFNGTRCELDYRPCKSYTCWNNGIQSLSFSLIKQIKSCFVCR
jgi:hypothetical protein